ncbi:MAG: hypothetical protein QME49_01665 [bacterium]|nr:hypothetical protein [bacterium]
MLAKTHKYKMPDNMKKYNGRKLKEITIVLLSPKIPFIEELTVEKLKRKIEIEIYKSGYDIVCFEITEEPMSNPFFGISFGKKFSTTIYCYPRTQDAINDYNKTEQKESVIKKEFFN